MPDLQFLTFHLALTPELGAAFVEELKSGGILEGIFCMRPSPVDDRSIFVMWMRTRLPNKMATVPRSAFGDPVAARETARYFVAIWVTRDLRDSHFAI